jgi:hypothetical protein
MSVITYLLYWLTSRTKVCNGCYEFAMADKSYVSRGDMLRCRDGEHWYRQDGEWERRKP